MQKTDKYLTFRLGDEDFGIAAETVSGVAAIKEFMRFTGGPEYILGAITQQDGSIVPLVDVRQRIHMEHRDFDRHTHVILVTYHHTCVGLIVDKVEEVIDIVASAIEPMGPGNNERAKYVSGVVRGEGAPRELLDITELLHQDILTLAAIPESIKAAESKRPRPRRKRPSRDSGWGGLRS